MAWLQGSIIDSLDLTWAFKVVVYPIAYNLAFSRINHGSLSVSEIMSPHAVIKHALHFKICPNLNLNDTRFFGWIFLAICILVVNHCAFPFSVSLYPLSFIMRVVAPFACTLSMSLSACLILWAIILSLIKMVDVMKLCVIRNKYFWPSSIYWSAHTCGVSGCCHLCHLSLTTRRWLLRISTRW